MEDLIEEVRQECQKLQKLSETCCDRFAALSKCLQDAGILRGEQFEACLHRIRFERVLRSNDNIALGSTLMTDIVNAPGVMHGIVRFTGVLSTGQMAACSRSIQDNIAISQQYAVRPLRIYMLGGSSAAHRPVSSALRFDIVSDTWHYLDPMPTARDVLAAVAVDGNLFAVGGTDGEQPFATVEKYSIVDNTWSPVEPMPTARGGLAAAVVSGRIYTVGGSDGHQALSTVESYSVETGDWQQCPPLLTPRRGVAIAATHRYLYALGGSDGNEALRTVERLDTEDGIQWEIVPPMPTPRRSASAAILNGRLFAIGGGGDERASTLDVAECFDLQNGTWQVLPPMPSARRGLAVFAVEGLIYALGGSDGNQASSAFEVFDPVANQWDVHQPLPVSRGYFGVAVLQTLEVLGLTEGTEAIHQLSQGLSRLRGGGKRSINSFSSGSSGET